MCKKIPRIIIILLSMIIVYGCEESNKKDKLNIEHILVNPDLAKDQLLTDVSDSIYVTKMRTKNSFTEFRKSLFLDDYIVILDIRLKIVYIFDKHGELINTLNKIGHARNEYLNINSCYYNKATNELYVHDNYSRKLLFYSFPELNYLRTVELSPSFRDVFYVNESDFLYTLADINELSANGLYITRKDSIQNIPIMDNSVLAIELSAMAPIIQKDSLIYFTNSNYQSIIYEINSSLNYKITPKFLIDFGEYAFKEESYFEGFEPDIIGRYYSDFTQNESSGVPFHHIISSDKIRFYYESKVYSYKRNCNSCVYDINSKTVNNYGKIFIPGIKKALTPIGTYKDFFVAMIIPEECSYDENKISEPIGEMILEEIKLVEEGREEIGSPILIFYRLK